MPIDSFAAAAGMHAQVSRLRGAALRHWRAALLAGTALAVAGGTAQAQTGPFLYVPNFNDGNVSVIDTSTNVAGTAVAVGTHPAGVGVTGDESFVYVANSSSNTVTPINTATNTAGTPIAVGNTPFDVVVTPNGQTVYVANQTSNTVTPINTATNTAGTPIAVGTNPTGLAVTPNGQTVYVANSGDNTVTPINTATNTAGTPIAVGVQPTGVAVTPDGKTVYVTNSSDGTVTPINTATNTAGTPIAVGSNPIGVAVSPDGTTVYVANSGSNTVTPINTATNTAGTPIAVGSTPYGVAISPDGTTVYVTNETGSNVTPIATATNTAGTAIAVGSFPLFSGICGNGNALLASGLTFKANTSGALACTQASGATGSAGPVFTGGTLQFTGAGITSALPISLQAAGGTVDTNGNNATLSGAISGPGSLTKIGVGILSLTNNGNNYSGGTNINAGTIRVSAANALGTGPVAIANGAELQNNLANLTIANAITLAAGNETIDTDGLAMTLSGQLSGAGAFFKTSSGTLTLTNNSNNFSGGINLNGGAIAAGANNALGTGTLAMASGTTLQSAAAGLTLGNAITLTGSGTIDTNSNNLTLSGAIADGAGTGTLNKNNAGTLILSGANTYSGATNVNGGTLEVDGSIASSSLTTVNSGATLLGNGSVGAVTLASGATLGAGTATTLGVLTTGNVTFQSGSAYSVKVNPSGSSDLVLAQGTADLKGGTVNVLAMSGGYQAQTKYIILSASNGLLSQFAGVTSNMAFLTPALSYDPNNAFLTLTNTQFTSGASTSTNMSVGQGLQNGAASGMAGPQGLLLLGEIENLSTQNAQTALNSLSGQATSATQETAFAAGGLFMSSMFDQAMAWLNGSRTAPGETGPTSVPLGYAADRPKKADPAVFDFVQGAQTYRTPGWRSWSTGFGGWTSLKDDTGSNLNLTHQTAGGEMGADYQANPNLLIGFGLGGSTSTFSLPDSATSGRLDGGHFGTYAIGRFGSFYAATVLSFSYFKNTTTRIISGIGATETATAAFDSMQAGARFEAGFTQTFNKVNVTPFAAVQYIDTFQTPYSETSVTALGAPGLLGLSYGPRDASSMPVSLGAQFDTRVTFGDHGLWAPFVRVAWVHELEPQRPIDALIQVLPSSFFTGQGVQADVNTVAIEAGTRLWLNQSVSAFATFKGDFSSRTQGYAATGGFDFAWDAEGKDKPSANAADTAQAQWTSSINPESHFTSWQGGRGFPTVGSTASGSGTQLYNFTTLQTSGTPLTDMSVNLVAKVGDVWSHQSTPGLSGSVTTPTDTTFTGTFTYTGMTGIQPFMSLSLNLPTGHPVLLGTAGNARVDSDFVDLGTFGEGLNVGPTVGVNLPFNEKLTVSVSGGYTHRGSYQTATILTDTAPQTTQLQGPGQEATANLNLTYIESIFNTALSASYSHDTLTYVNGTPSYRPGDRYVASATETITWSPTSNTALTGTYIHSNKNGSLNTLIEQFDTEVSNSNSTLIRGRIDQAWVSGAWTFAPFGTYMFRDHNTYDPIENQFVSAKTMWSAGVLEKYAINDKISLSGSLERFWATELADAGSGVPEVKSTGWRAILTGSYTF